MIEMLIAAGINPKNGLPLKITDPSKIKTNIKRMLRIIDEQDAVNRYTWYNLPCNITSQELERLLYYKGQLCLFYSEELDQFFFMPYALDGTIDFYGRYNRIHPVPMTSGEETTEEEKRANENQAAILSNIKLDCVYGLVSEDSLSREVLTKSCVLLHDYTKQLAQTIIPRTTINDAIVDVMAECVPFMRTSLILSTGVKGLRVPDADSESNAKTAARSLLKAALEGESFMPMIGSSEFQELMDGATGKSEEFMLAMQSLDNLRLSTYGIDNGGLFEKKAHQLEVEAEVNGGPIGLVLQDGLEIRQNFCNIVNSIWGLNIWCEPSETILNMDIDGDGLAYDRDEDASQTGVEDSNYGGEEDA